ncbi:MAG: GGDEF domain-containing protein [Rubrivivax sp.]
MDPKTIIFVLAMHLLCMGGLFALIGRYMPRDSGLASFAAGGLIFGSAYALRLAIGLGSAWLIHAVLDAAMVLAASLVVNGLRQFVGRRSLPGRTLAFAALAFLALHAGTMSAFGEYGRYVLLNTTLALVYLSLSLSALGSRRRSGPELNLPLCVLAALTGTLGLSTLARAGVIAVQGPAAVYAGPFAQAYYTFASMHTVLLAPVLLWMVFTRLNRQLARQAAHDPMTWLLNRQGLDDALHCHFGAPQRAPITLLQVDIDHFKRVNDQHGHAAGDAVIKQVAERLSHSVRAGDIVARTGGEEFLVGCIGVDADAALALAERLRQAVAEARMPLPGSQQTLACTVSIGVSRPCHHLRDWEAAFREADHALYAAKQDGRNRVHAAALARPPGRAGDAAPRSEHGIGARLGPA